MDLQKILVLLITIIIYVNYTNYVEQDLSKLDREIVTLNANIKREINIQKGKYTKESLKVKYNDFMFDGEKYSYSKAMGEMQNVINISAKNLCGVKRIQWAQVPNSKNWYDKLRMNISLACTPKNLLRLTNKLAKDKRLFVIENARIIKNRNKAMLNINMQLIAFRTHK